MIKTLLFFGRSFVSLFFYRLVICFFVFAFSALSLFGLSSDDFDPPTVVRVYTFTSFVSLSNYQTSHRVVQCYGSPYSVYLNFPFGISFSSSSGQINLPVFTGVLTNSAVDVKYPIQSRELHSTKVVWLSPYLFDDVRSLFVSLVSLYNSGYRGAGVVDVSSSTTTRAVNFDYRAIVADVLSSTNSTYRQIILSHLSSIQASVQNIELNVSGLQSSLDVGNVILSSVSNSLENVSSNITDVSSLVSGVHSNSLLTASSVSDIRDLFNLINNPILDFPVWLDTMVYCGVIDQSSADSWLRSYGDFQNPTSRADFVSLVQSEIKDVNFAETFIRVFNSSSLSGAGSSFNESVVDALIGDYSTRSNLKAVNTRTSIKSEMRSWRDELKEQLQQWKNEAKQQLQDWKTSDERGILNIKETIEDNFSYRMGGYTNQIPFTVFVTNFVTGPITGSVQNASQNIQSNATSNAKDIIKNDDERWGEFKDLATGDGQGINVRIKWPLEYETGHAVNVHDGSVVAAIDRLTAWKQDLTAIAEAVDWITSGGPVNVNIPSNTLDRLDEILEAIKNIKPNSYLLLDHYSHYISNDVYSVSINRLREDFPNVYTNLTKYGLSSDNFWTLFGANLIYQSGLIGSLLDDIAFVRNFADDHIEGGFAAGIQSIVDKFPSSTQLEDDLNNATNGLADISLSVTNFVIAFSAVTNFNVSVFRPFSDSFDSPPSEDLVLFRLPNDEYASIPVRDQPEVWSLIRKGIAFSLIAVQFILFPKFVLMFVVLFSRLSNRFVKFVPTDR